MSEISDRKQQHIALALEEGSQGKGNGWEGFQLPYKALPEINLSDVTTETELLGKRVSQPLIIASMTGGSVHAEAINSHLAQACEAAGVAMGVGSQRVALEKDEAKKTFSLVRKFAPSAVIFANMGAVQLNYGRGVEDYQRIVDMVEADGLYVHINPMQEALQPGGDTDFSGLLAKIENLISKISVPVFVKEVGCGLDPVTARRLIEIGAAGIDVAGTGGTSWTWIEGTRSGNSRMTEWFADFGLPTEMLVEALGKEKGQTMLVASGGIRNPIQGLKAGLMGADYYSAAYPFLAAAMTSAEAVSELLTDWQQGLKIALFGIGSRSWKEAKNPIG